MRALRFDPSRPPGSRVALEDLAEPTAAPGEALLAPLRVAITGLDIHTAQGQAPLSPTGPEPITLGSAFVAQIIDASPASDADAKALERLKGHRATASPATACGNCDLCKRGLAAHCRDRTILGLSKRNGCLADRFTMPIRNLVAVPETLDDDRAAFAPTLASAIHVAQQIRIEGRAYITVLGDGRLGLLCAQTLAKLNASVRVLGKHTEKLDLCARWGVKHRPVHEAGLRADQDVVVDCTGHPSGLTTALGLVRPMGTIVLKSTSPPPGTPAPGTPDISPDLRAAIRNEIQLLGSGFGPLPEALRMLDREEIDAVSLLTKRAKLEDGRETIRAAMHPSAIGVVVEL